MTIATPSLNALYDALLEERRRTWDPAALKTAADQRRTLVEAAGKARFVRAGDKVPAFSLLDVEGGVLNSTDLLRTGPIALIFFRFADCPACNIALPFYDQHLAPSLSQAGIRLFAVSPQRPDRLLAIKQRHALSLDVATDPGNTLGRAFGILYEYDEASKQAALAGNRFIGDVTGTGTWELPQPAIVVIDQDATVRFADVSPDWLRRTEPALVQAALNGLHANRAA